MISDVKDRGKKGIPTKEVKGRKGKGYVNEKGVVDGWGGEEQPKRF